MKSLKAISNFQLFLPDFTALDLLLAGQFQISQKSEPKGKNLIAHWAKMTHQADTQTVLHIGKK